MLPKPLRPLFTEINCVGKTELEDLFRVSQILGIFSKLFSPLCTCMYRPTFLRLSMHFCIISNRILEVTRFVIKSVGSNTCFAEWPPFLGNVDDFGAYQYHTGIQFVGI